MGDLSSWQIGFEAEGQIIYWLLSIKDTSLKKILQVVTFYLFQIWVVVQITITQRNIDILAYAIRLQNYVKGQIHPSVVYYICPSEPGKVANPMLDHTCNVSNGLRDPTNFSLWVKFFFFGPKFGDFFVASIINPLFAISL